jgi:hypothetical protein
MSNEQLEEDLLHQCKSIHMNANSDEFEDTLNLDGIAKYLVHQFNMQYKSKSKYISETAERLCDAYIEVTGHPIKFITHAEFKTFYIELTKLESHLQSHLQNYANYGGYGRKQSSNFNDYFTPKYDLETIKQLKNSCMLPIKIQTEDIIICEYFIGNLLKDKQISIPLNQLDSLYEHIIQILTKNISDNTNYVMSSEINKSKTIIRLTIRKCTDIEDE